MGTIDFFCIPSSLCIDRTSHRLGSSCSVEGKLKRSGITYMASSVPVKEESQQHLGCSVKGDSFIRPHLRKLSPYQPILPFEILSTRLGRKPEDIVKLDANENPYGPPPEVLEALGSMRFPYIYPDPESRSLRAALAEDSGIESEYILAGCGADELIDLIMRCVLDPGDKIVDCPPTFTMYEFDAAVNAALVIKVAKKLERIQREFLWGGLGEERKLHLVNWRVVCSPIRSGGLGLRSLVLFNKALLGKWLWRFGVERESFWREIIGAKYGVMEGGWCSGERRGSYGVSLWRYIRRGWNDFRDRLTFIVGNGSSISFWDDCWCGHQPLKLVFPSLYRIALEPSVMVYDVLESHNGSSSWNIAFGRDLQDWELEDYALFLTSLYEVHIRVGEGDCSRWKLTRDGIFSVCTYFRSLLGIEERSFPWKMVWKCKLPPRVAFLLWAAVRGQILTVDNLRTRGFYVTEWCYMCKRDGETIDHLFLHCENARLLWNDILSSQNMDWVLPRNLEDLLKAWRRKLRDKDSKLVWDLIPGCIVWCLWRERNNRCFEDQSRTIAQIRELFYLTLYTWFNTAAIRHIDGLPNFISFFSELK